MVCYRKKSQPGQLWVATQPTTPIGGSQPSFTAWPVAWNEQALSLHVSIASLDLLSRTDDVLVWAMVASSQSSGGDAQVCWQLGATGKGVTGVLNGFDYDPSSNGSPCLTVGHSTLFNGKKATFFLYLPQAEDVIQIWHGDSLDSGPMHRVDAPGYIQAPQPPQGTVVTDIETLTQLQGDALMPSALVWTQKESYDGGVAGDPQLWALMFPKVGATRWVWTNLGIPRDLPHDFELPVTTALTPRTKATEGNLLDVFVCWDAKLYVSRQIEQAVNTDMSSPAFTPMIPLQKDVSTMTSQAGVTAGNQLIVVGTDGMLQTLAKDAVSGAWTDAVIHPPASEMQQNSSYRVTLTLADTVWNAPVTSHALTITASTPAVAMVEGPTPRTVQLGATPVTVSTDTTGEVVLALLADGLSAPTLTVTADGLPKPATVYPSAAVNTYMQGGGTLNFLPAMSTETLTTATTPDGQILTPDAAQNPAETDRQVTNMKQAADLGAQGTKVGAVSSTLARIDGGRPAHGRRTHQRPGANVGVKALGANIDNWSHDVFHAIKKGAADVQTVTVDVEKKIVTIAVDVAGWVGNTVQVIVHTIEDAAQVLHAAFNRLGADIAHAVKWLEVEVIGVFKDSKLVSDKFHGWLGDFTGFAGTQVAAGQVAALGWLENEKSDVTTRLKRLAGQYPASATLATMADTAPARIGTRRRPAPSANTAPSSKHSPTHMWPAIGDDDTSGAPHGDWFYQKIKHELAGSGVSLDLSSVSAQLGDKLKAWGDKSAAHSPGFQAAYRDEFWLAFIAKAIKQVADVGGVSVALLLDALIDILDATFDFAENIVTETFDVLRDVLEAIPQMLNDTTLGHLPILGALFRLIGLGDLSIGRVVNMIFAFPATLTYKLKHGASTRPFAQATLGRTGRPVHTIDPEQLVGDIAGDLQITAASVMGTWAVFDTLSAAFTASNSDGGVLFTCIDIYAPLIVTILTTPATNDAEPFFAPPVSGKPADVYGFLAWIFGSMPAFCAAAPLVFERFYPGEDYTTVRKEFGQIDIWFQGGTGLLALIFGMIGNSYKDQPKGADYAGAVLNNMSTVAAPGLSDIVTEATEGISVAVVMALTLICGGIGATIYGIDG